MDGKYKSLAKNTLDAIKLHKVEEYLNNILLYYTDTDQSAPEDLLKLLDPDAEWEEKSKIMYTHYMEMYNSISN